MAAEPRRLRKKLTVRLGGIEPSAGIGGTI